MTDIDMFRDYQGEIKQLKNKIKTLKKEIDTLKQIIDFQELQLEQKEDRDEIC
jgi:predicted  nucleic acid-binding Zn-ribbon protein